MELHNLSAEEQYRLLIQFRRDHPVPDGVYGEIHHIQPRSCGGSDDQENLVKLLPEEHYKAHALLPQVMLERNNIDGYQKMLYAWNTMRTRASDLEVESKEYGHLKRQYAIVASERARKQMTGYKPTEERKRHQSEALKGRKHTAEHNARVSAAKKGKKFSEKHRAALSAARQGMQLSASHRAAIGAAHRGRKWDADFCRKVSEAKKKYWAEKRAELLQQDL